MPIRPAATPNDVFELQPSSPTSLSWTDSPGKSRGFPIHKSHLADPARLSRWLITACLAYIWMIAQGLHVISENNTSLLDRTERIDKSLFRLGLDWLKYALKKNIEFEPMFWFQPLNSTVNVR